MFNHSGNYEFQISRKYDSRSYYTFTPKPLCSLTDNVLPMDEQMMMLISQAHRLLGILEGISRYIPDIDTYINLLMKKEAHLSYQIDGITTPFYDILDSNNEKSKNAMAILNCVTAMQYAQREAVSNQLICEIQGIALKDSVCKNIGKFRETQIFLKPYVSSNIQEYNPTAPEDLESALDDFEKFMTADDNIDLLIKSALVHYQFEIIHPFEKGNGRVGRILAMLVLLQNKVLSKPVISLSYDLFHDKAEYFDRLSSTQLNGNYAQWVKFFIKAIIVAADNSIKQIESFIAIRNKNIEKIMVLGKASKNAMHVYKYIEKSPIIKIPSVANELNSSFNTAAKIVEAMVGCGILKQENNQSRHRHFIYEDYVKIFDMV
ncbi:MAG: Fic family protein [Desulfosporosinus sp.]